MISNLDFRKKDIWGYFMLFLILFVSFYQMEQHLTTGHDWGGDFALYLNQAQAINQGELAALYHSNQFTVEKSDRLIGPYLYPMGYPLLLSPVIALIGLNFYWLKIYTSLFFYLGLILLYRLIKPHFKTLYPALLLISFLSFSEFFLFHGDQLLSDFPFFFFVILSLSYFKKDPTRLQQVLLAILILFTYLIRELGIMLLPALLVYQLSIYKPKEILKSYSISYLLFLVLLILSFILFPFGSKNHFSLLLAEISWNSFQENFTYYAELLEGFFRGLSKSDYLAYILLLLFLVGLFEAAKKLSHWITFLFFSVLVLMLWPYQQGMRFLFVCLPFILFFLLKPIERLPKWPRYLLLYPLTFYLFSIFFVNTQAQNQKNLALETNQIYQKETKALYEYVRENYNEEDTIVFFKPRVLSMLCEVKSIYLQPDSFMNSPYPTLITSPWYPPRKVDSNLFVTNFGPYGIFQKAKPN